MDTEKTDSAEDIEMDTINHAYATDDSDHEVEKKDAAQQPFDKEQLKAIELLLEKTLKRIKIFLLVFGLLILIGFAASYLLIHFKLCILKEIKDVEQSPAAQMLASKVDSQNNRVEMRLNNVTEDLKKLHDVSSKLAKSLSRYGLEMLQELRNVSSFNGARFSAVSTLIDENRASISEAKSAFAHFKGMLMYKLSNVTSSLNRLGVQSAQIKDQIKSNGNSSQAHFRGLENEVASLQGELRNTQILIKRNVTSVEKKVERHRNSTEQQNKELKQMVTMLKVQASRNTFNASLGVLMHKLSSVTSSLNRLGFQSAQITAQIKSNRNNAQADVRGLENEVEALQGELRNTRILMRRNVASVEKEVERNRNNSMQNNEELKQMVTMLQVQASSHTFNASLGMLTYSLVNATSSLYRLEDQAAQLSGQIETIRRISEREFNDLRNAVTLLQGNLTSSSNNTTQRIGTFELSVVAVQRELQRSERRLTQSLSSVESALGSHRKSSKLENQELKQSVAALQARSSPLIASLNRLARYQNDTALDSAAIKKIVTSVKAQVEKNHNVSSQELPKLQNSLNVVRDLVTNLIQRTRDESRRVQSVHANIRDTIESNLAAYNASYQNMKDCRQEVISATDSANRYLQQLNNARLELEMCANNLTLTESEAALQSTRVTQCERKLTSANDKWELAKSLRAMTKAASLTFPASFSNFYQFKYDGTRNDSISDGGHDMYDGGNKLRVWKDNQVITIDYNATYRAEDGSFVVSSATDHPFVLAMLIRNEHQRQQSFYIEESGNLGADGSGSYTTNSGSFNEGQINAVYRTYQVYAATDPSIIQIFLTMSSSQLFNSTGYSSLYFNDYQPGTGLTNNTARLSGRFSNQYFTYILASRRPPDRVSSSEMRSALVAFVRSFQIIYKP